MTTKGCHCEERGDKAISTTMMRPEQPSLLEPAFALPEGLEYRESFVSREEEASLVERLSGLELKEFEFHGYLGRRRVASFGLRYDFNDMAVRDAAPLPEFLRPVRDRAAAFAGLEPEALGHALVTEYTAGAAIGWHRDRAVFGDVIGVSFVSPCRFRFRRKRGESWDRRSLTLAPRSAYLLRGPARHEWQHSIPPVEALRYSVTFRGTR
jgi:alkylated DNA repair dioxygenase AlkB